MKVLAALVFPLRILDYYWIETPSPFSSSYEEFSHTVEQKEKL